MQYSTSFIKKLPESISTAFSQIIKLKASLKHQIEKCEEDINQDLKKFKASVKKQVFDGIMKGTGDKSIKRTNNAIRDELSKMHEALKNLQNRVEKDGEEEDNKKDN